MGREGVGREMRGSGLHFGSPFPTWLCEEGLLWLNTQHQSQRQEPTQGSLP